jgi:hypothetical protein
MAFDKILSSFKNFVEEGEAKYVRGEIKSLTELPTRKPLQLAVDTSPTPIPDQVYGIKVPFTNYYLHLNPKDIEYIQYGLTILLLLVGTYALYANRTPKFITIKPPSS